MLVPHVLLLQTDLPVYTLTRQFMVGVNNNFVQKNQLAKLRAIKNGQNHINETICFVSSLAFNLFNFENWPFVQTLNLKGFLPKKEELDF